MKRQPVRSPLDRAKPLRVPGQSISEQLDDVLYEHMLAPVLIALFMVVVAALEWWRFYTDAKPNPLIYSTVAGACVFYAGVKILRNQHKVRQMKLGRDGERVVAQQLEWLRREDFFVFHDVPNGDANVDHLLIGPKGIFTIETKTLSKPERGECKIAVVDGVIRANGRALDRDPLIQAKAQAGWLRAFLAEHQFTAPVWPVVLFPGWFVEPFDSKIVGAWVLEPKALRSFIGNRPDRFALEDVKAMASAMTSYIRSQAK